MTTLEIILSSVLGGGVISFIMGILTMRSKVKQEQTATKDGQVELTDKILDKYQESVMERMRQTDELTKRIAELQESGNRNIVTSIETMHSEVKDLRKDVNDIVTYLNGDFKKFREQKRNEKGQFCK